MKLIETLRGRKINGKNDHLNHHLNDHLNNNSNTQDNIEFTNTINQTEDSMDQQDNNTIINTNNIQVTTEQQNESALNRNHYVQSTVGGIRNPKCSKCRNHNIHVPVKSKSVFNVSLSFSCLICFMLNHIISLVKYIYAILLVKIYAILLLNFN